MFPAFERITRIKMMREQLMLVESYNIKRRRRRREEETPTVSQFC